MPMPQLHRDRIRSGDNVEVKGNVSISKYYLDWRAKDLMQVRIQTHHPLKDHSESETMLATPKLLARMVVLKISVALVQKP